MQINRELIALLFREGPWFAWHALRRKLGAKTARLRIDGRRFLVPIGMPGGMQLLYGREPWMLPLLQRELSTREGAFVDVGANVGQTLTRLKSIDFDRRWIGFEPSQACCEVLERVIELNSLPHCTLIRKALSDRTGTAQLFTTNETDEAASMIEGFRRGVGIRDRLRQVEIETVDGRELADRELAETIAFIKIDVEGAEPEVLRGLEHVIERDRPVILCELLPVGPEDSSQSNLRAERTQETLALFGHRGYRLSRVTSAGGLEDVDEIPRDVPWRLSNYLALPDVDK